MTSIWQTKKYNAKLIVRLWKDHTPRDVKHYSRGIRRYKKQFRYMNPKFLGEQYMKKMMERHEKWLYEISSERIRDLLEKTNLNTNKLGRENYEQDRAESL